MTGRENGSSTATTASSTMRDALRPRRQDRRLGAVARVEVRPAEHPHTLLISGVPNRPYGLTSSTISITT